MMILPSISTRDLIRELQNVTACLRTHRLESPRAVEVSSRHIHLDRATAQRKQEEEARDNGEKVDGDIRRLLSKGASYVSILICFKTWGRR